MAQWKKLLNLDSVHQNEVIQVYTDQKFPWDIRRHFSDWIESQNWESVSSDEGQARDVFHAMLNQVDGHYSHLVQENNLLDGPNYPDLRNNLQTLFQANPVNMAKIISQCLSEERRIIASVKMAQDCTANNAAMEGNTGLDDSIRELKRDIEDTQDSQIKTIIELSGKYKPRQDEVEQLNGLPISLDLKRQKTDIDVVHFDLIQTRLNVGHLIGNTVKLAEGVVSTVVEEELQSWKLRQQRACIGAPLDTSLHKLKTWFTLAADALNLQLQQLKKLKELDQQCPPNADLLSLRTKCEETTQSLLKNLLKNALVVETQPRVNNAQRPLILKTGVRFSIKTRFLVHLSSFVGMPRVTLVFNKDLDENGTVKGFRNFNFTNKASRMLDAEEMGLVAHFENLTLKEEKSTGSRQVKGLLPVTEELHFITCAMKLKLIGLTIDIETSTLPLVVISSTAQSHGAWASILWSAMAVEQPKNLWFQNPPSVTWKQLSEVLSWQFQAMSGRGLDHQQLAMLRDKFVDNDDDLVYWNKFYRCDGGWVWIEGILDLITKHLLPIWSEGHIMGFISKESTEQLLRGKPTGTFLLRFSESIKEGAITFSWVDHSTPKGVYAVQPYNKTELGIKQLAKILCTYHPQGTSNNNKTLLFLYPDIPMDHAFQKYLSNPGIINNGYVGRDTEHVWLDLTPPASPEENIPPILTDDMDFTPMEVEASELHPELFESLVPLDWVDMLSQ